MAQFTNAQRNAVIKDVVELADIAAATDIDTAAGIVRSVLRTFGINPEVHSLLGVMDFETESKMLKLFEEADSL